MGIDDPTLLRENQVDAAIAEFMLAVESGKSPDVDSFLARHGEIANELNEFFRDASRFGVFVRDDSQPKISSPQKRPSMDSVRSLGVEVSTEIYRAVDTSPDILAAPLTGQRFGDYDLIAELAHGGMGVVYKARQLRLNRIVALKMILRGELASDEDVARFHAEAAAAAKLDHPGIVPVYEVGEWNGQHFFSMGFVDGQSLAARLKQDDKPLAPREAAELLAQVADAVSYAHGQQVVHRDLKPGNVLVDQRGQPRVTDFGLAKVLSNRSELTRSGQILGTPAYMAPEQAAGQNDRVGPLADVYSLGAMLYCLLTGRPPFQSANVLETLRQVRYQEPIPLRQISPELPQDLETIAMKCLEKEPARRYASAQALADELRRYLRHEPILGRPITRRERLIRWSRRSPAVARLVLAIVALVSTGLIAVTGLWLRADSNWHESQRQKVRGDRTVADLKAGVEDMFTQISEETLLDEPGWQPLRKRLLERALPYYEKISQAADDESATATARFDVAKAHSRLAFIYRTLGRPTDSVREFQAARTLWDELFVTNPSDRRVRFESAKNLVQNAAVAAEGDRSRTSLDMLARARGILEQLLSEQPSDFAAEGALAVCVFNTALTTSGRDFGRAIELYSEAADRFRKLLSRADAGSPADRVFWRRTLAGCLTNSGHLLHATSTLAKTQEVYEPAAAELEALASENPRLGTLWFDLVYAHIHLGNVLNELGQQEEARQRFRRAVEVGERLSRENPAVSDYKGAWVGALLSLSSIYHGPTEATDSVLHSQRAVDLVEELVTAEPDQPGHLSTLGTAHEYLGWQLIDAGKPAEGRASHERALTHRQEHLSRRPTHSGIRWEVGASHYNLGDILTKSGEFDLAEQHFRSARELFEQTIREQPENNQFHQTYAQSLDGLATLAAKAQRRDEAIELRQLALRDLAPLLANSSRIDSVREAAVGHGRQLSALLVEADRFVEATAVAVDQSRFARDGAQELFAAATDIAKTLTSWKARLSRDAAMPPSEFADAAQQAVLVLSRAIDRGFQDRKTFESDTAWGGLRERDDVQQQLKRLTSTFEEQSAPSTKSSSMTLPVRRQVRPIVFSASSWRVGPACVGKVPPWSVLTQAVSATIARTRIY